MRGFDYRSNTAVDKSIAGWRTVAQEVTRKGGLVREEKKLGETWIIGKKGLVAEVYGVNLNLGKETTNG